MLSDNPIESLVKTAMASIKEMVDVNTVVGDPVETPDGSIIIPISRVSCGFGAGGGEYRTANEGNGAEKNNNSQSNPFGGGSGAGVSVHPMGFLVVGNGQVRFLPVGDNVMYDRLIDMLPDLIDKFKAIYQHKHQGREARVPT